jgi:hypothetical protein
MTSLSWIGVNPPQHKLIIAAILVLMVAIMILTPKIKLTCNSLLSFICALVSVVWQSWQYYLKPVRRMIQNMMSMRRPSKREEWLDETEMRITE